MRRFGWYEDFEKSLFQQPARSTARHQKDRTLRPDSEVPAKYKGMRLVLLRSTKPHRASPVIGFGRLRRAACLYLSISGEAAPLREVFTTGEGRTDRHYPGTRIGSSPLSFSKERGPGGEVFPNKNRPWLRLPASVKRRIL